MNQYLLVILGAIHLALIVTGFSTPLLHASLAVFIVAIGLIDAWFDYQMSKIRLAHLEQLDKIFADAKEKLEKEIKKLEK